MITPTLFLYLIRDRIQTEYRMVHECRASVPSQNMHVPTTSRHPPSGSPILPTFLRWNSFARRTVGNDNFQRAHLKRSSEPVAQRITLLILNSPRPAAQAGPLLLSPLFRAPRPPHPTPSPSPIFIYGLAH